MPRGGAEKEEEEKDDLYIGRKEGAYTSKGIHKVGYAQTEKHCESNKI